MNSGPFVTGPRHDADSRRLWGAPDTVGTVLVLVVHPFGEVLHLAELVGAAREWLCSRDPIRHGEALGACVRVDPSSLPGLARTLQLGLPGGREAERPAVILPARCAGAVTGRPARSHFRDLLGRLRAPLRLQALDARSPVSERNQTSTGPRRNLERGYWQTGRSEAPQKGLRGCGIPTRLAANRCLRGRLG